MEEFLLNISKPQLRKLQGGRSVQVKHSMMGSGMKLKMHASKAKKLRSAHRRGKGSRLMMTREEIEASGLTWAEFKRGARKVGRKIVQGAKVAGEFYKKNLKSTVGPILKEGAQVGVRTLGKIATDRTGNPNYEYVANRVADEVIPKLGEDLGAWGYRNNQMYHLSMVDPVLPASRPLVNVGNPQYGDMYIK